MKEIALIILIIAISSTVIFAQRKKKKNKIVENVNTENTTREIPKPESSILNLPISIKMSALEKAINTQINGLIYEDNSFENYGQDDLMIKAWKKDKIRLGLKDNVISYYVPIKLWIKVRYKVLGFTDTRVVEGAIAFNMATAFEMQENWDLKTKTTMENYQWLETPTIDLGVTKLSIKMIVNRVLATNKELLTKTIDEEIKKNLDIEMYANDAWKMAQQPVLLDSTYKAWLKLTPESVVMKPLVSENGTLKSTIGIKAISEIVVGEQPKVEKYKRLPPFREVDAVKDDFQVTLSTAIAYTEAERLAKSGLVGQTFSQGKRSVTVEDIEVSGEGELLKINTTLSGKLKGSIFMTGRPVYNKETSSIELQDFDFDLKSKNILHKSAEWLLHSTILKKMAPYMNFSLAENLTYIRKMVEDNLANYEIAEGILINGELDEMEIKDIFLGENGIHVRVIANGKIDMKVDGLTF